MMAQQHLALAKVRMLRCITFREAAARSFAGSFFLAFSESNNCQAVDQILRSGF